jgi:hypothetical protein
MIQYSISIVKYLKSNFIGLKKAKQALLDGVFISSSIEANAR